MDVRRGSLRVLGRRRHFIFYIGRIGGGITGGKNSVFNTTTAGQAGYLQTFAYWDLEGPDLNDTGDTMTQWGTAQAQAFVDAWVNGYYKDYVGGSTFFLDIEFGKNGRQGWGTPSTPAGTGVAVSLERNWQ